MQSFLIKLESKTRDLLLLEKHAIFCHQINQYCHNLSIIYLHAMNSDPKVPLLSTADVVLHGINLRQHALHQVGLDRQQLGAELLI